VKKKLKENGLTLVLFVLFAVTVIGQILTGWRVNNDERKDEGQPPLTLSSYLTSGHFGEALFENWESEFLQMGLYVALTIFLRQKGCPESKPLEGQTEVDREPDPKKKDAPWPVKKGGLWLELYSSSLTSALVILFAVSLVFHGFAGTKAYNEDQIRKGKAVSTVPEFMVKPQFWFESFQNWQSEFMSIGALLVLGIYLRQKGSPESKPVDAPHSQTGSEG
jgi:hypothetical protein